MVYASDKTELSITELAEALGVSRQMVHRHAKEGMPTHSVEAARRWREENLDPGFTKDAQRFNRWGDSDSRRPSPDDEAERKFFEIFRQGALDIFDRSIQPLATVLVQEGIPVERVLKALKLIFILYWDHLDQASTGHRFPVQLPTFISMISEPEGRKEAIRIIEDKAKLHLEKEGGKWLDLCFGGKPRRTPRPKKSGRK
ncbi:MAG: HTH domain-containing protein [Nitrospirae bacterium]|nr:HTH domain-containing protein [Nitrospirota bacterium]